MLQNAMMPLGKREGTAFFPALARPKSRGSITLQSNNHEDPPLVDFNIFGDEADLNLAVKGKYCDNYIHCASVIINITGK